MAVVINVREDSSDNSKGACSKEASKEPTNYDSLKVLGRGNRELENCESKNADEYRYPPAEEF
jgi:hypothetical protein